MPATTSLSSAIRRQPAWVADECQLVRWRSTLSSAATLIVLHGMGTVIGIKSYIYNYLYLYCISKKK
jgi:hypothetical protein